MSDGYRIADETSHNPEEKMSPQWDLADVLGVFLFLLIIFAVTAALGRFLNFDDDDKWS